MNSHLTIQSFRIFSTSYIPFVRQAKSGKKHIKKKTKLKNEDERNWYSWLVLCFSFFKITQIVWESRAHKNVAAWTTHFNFLSISHYYSERCTTTIIFSFHHSFVPFRLRRTSPELSATPLHRTQPTQRACVRFVCAQLFYHSLGFVSAVVAREPTIIHLRP